MHVRTAQREATLPLPTGIALSRTAFDAALIRAAIGAGAAFLPQAEARLDPTGSLLRKLELRTDGQLACVTARIAVSADGLSGGFLKAFQGLNWIVAPHSPLGAGAVFDDSSESYPAGTIFMGCAPAGYVGLVRLEDGRLDVAMALDRGQAQSSGGTSAAALAILKASRLPCPAALVGTSFRGTPYLTRRRQRVAAHGLVVIGDAAGYVEPLTGEGMAWAMQQAMLAAPLICDAIARSQPEYVLHWQQQYERLFRYRRGVCRTAGWLRRNYRFGNLILGMLARVPALAAPWVRAVNRPSRQICQSTAP